MIIVDKEVDIGFIIKMKPSDNSTSCNTLWTGTTGKVVEIINKENGLTYMKLELIKCTVDSYKKGQINLVSFGPTNWDFDIISVNDWNI